MLNTGRFDWYTGCGEKAVTDMGSNTKTNHPNSGICDDRSINQNLGKNRHLRPDSITSYVLSDIANSVDEYSCLQSFKGKLPIGRFSYENIHVIKELPERIKYQKALHELKKNKLISVKNKRDIYKVAITKKGAKELFRLKVLSSYVLPEGHDCVVVFDIPEIHRALRAELRRFLHEACFLQIQKSVWVSNFDAGEALIDLFKNAGVDQWVRVYTAKQLK